MHTSKCAFVTYLHIVSLKTYEFEHTIRPKHKQPHLKNPRVPHLCTTMWDIRKLEIQIKWATTPSLSKHHSSLCCPPLLPKPKPKPKQESLPKDFTPTLNPHAWSHLPLHGIKLYIYTRYKRRVGGNKKGPYQRGGPKWLKASLLQKAPRLLRGCCLCALCLSQPFIVLLSRQSSARAPTSPLCLLSISLSLPPSPPYACRWGRAISVIFE